jgi:hypothetical protein
MTKLLERNKPGIIDVFLEATGVPEEGVEPTLTVRRTGF